MIQMRGRDIDVDRDTDTNRETETDRDLDMHVSLGDALWLRSLSPRLHGGLGLVLCGLATGSVLGSRMERFYSSVGLELRGFRV